MKKCLVTGASGLLGREVSTRLAGSYEVVRQAFAHAEPGMITLDLRDAAELWEVVDEELRPDVVVHCAAYRDPDFCEAHPQEMRRLNVDPVRELCEMLRPDCRLVFVSSDYVFDGEHPPYREDSLRDPVNLYGQSKMEAENAVLNRPNSVVVRMPVLIGQGTSWEGSGFLFELFQSVKSRQPQELDDVMIRCPTWTRDAADAIAFLLERGAEGVFHISGPRGGTRYAWTVEMASLMGATAEHLKPLKKIMPKQAGRPRDSHLATDKIRSAGFPAFTDFAVAAREVLAAFKPATP